MLTDITESQYLDAALFTDGIFILFTSQLGHGREFSMKSASWRLSSLACNTYMVTDLRGSDDFRLVNDLSKQGHRVLTSMVADSAIGALEQLYEGVSDPEFWRSIPVGSRIEHQQIIPGIDPFSSMSMSEYSAVHAGEDEFERMHEALWRISNSNQGRVRFCDDPFTVVPDKIELPYGMIRHDENGRLMLILRETIVIDELIKELLVAGKIEQAKERIVQNGHETIRDYALKSVLAGRLDPFKYEAHGWNFSSN